MLYDANGNIIHAHQEKTYRVYWTFIGFLTNPDAVVCASADKSTPEERYFEHIENGRIRLMAEGRDEFDADQVNERARFEIWKGLNAAAEGAPPELAFVQVYYIVVEEDAEAAANIREIVGGSIRWTPQNTGKEV